MILLLSTLIYSNKHSPVACNVDSYPFLRVQEYLCLVHAFACGCLNDDVRTFGSLLVVQNRLQRLRLQCDHGMCKQCAVLTLSPSSLCSCSCIKYLKHQCSD